MAEDGLQDVYLKQAGTGAAYILNGPKEDLSTAIRRRTATQQAAQAQKQKAAADKEAKRREAYANLEINLGEVYDKHLPYFDKLESQIIDMAAQLEYKGKDLDNYSDPDVATFHKAYKKAVRQAKASENQIAYIQQMDKMYAENKDQFDPSAIEEWNNYRDQDFLDMINSNPPDPTPNIDEATYGQKILKDHLASNQDGYAYMDSDGLFHRGTTEVTGEEQKQEAAIPYWQKANPYLKARIQKEIEALDDAEYERIAQKMRTINQQRAKRGVKGQPPPKPLNFQETYILDNRLAGTEGKKVQKFISGSGSFAAGYRQELKSADLFVQRLKGLGEGDPALYKDVESELPVSDERMNPEDKGRYKQSSVLSEYSLGSEDDAPKLDKVYYDSKTGLVAYTSVDDEVNEFSDLKKLEWMPEEALYSELGIKVLEGQKKIPRQAVEEYIHNNLPPEMRSMGEVWLQNIPGKPVKGMPPKTPPKSVKSKPVINF